MAFVRCGWPLARWYSRASFQPASTDSEPPLVKNALLSSPGARSASFSASSIAGGWAVPQFVLNASRVICSAAAETISSP
jgi:hypothetical protein